MFKLLIVLFCLASAPVHSACQEVYRLFGIMNLENKSWETTRLESKPEKVCISLDDKRPNLELSLTKQKKNFKVRIFSSLQGYWDSLDANKKMVGGTFKEKNILIETYVPLWVKGSKMTITDINQKKKLLETKL